MQWLKKYYVKEYRFLFYISNNIIQHFETKLGCETGSNVRTVLSRPEKNIKGIRKSEWNGCGGNQRKYILCSPTLRAIINKTVYTDNSTSDKYYWYSKRLTSDGRKYKTLTELYLLHIPTVASFHIILYHRRNGGPPKYSFLHQFI